MATLNCVVAVGTDDWDDASTTADNLSTRGLRDFGGVITVNDSAYVDLTTSTIDSSWTINSATLHFKTVSNTKSPKGDSFNSVIYIDNSGWQIIDSVAVQRATGWDSITLTTAEIALINNTGKTSFRFTAPVSSTSSSSNIWLISAYELDPDGTNSVYLEIDYTEPSTGLRRRAIIIS